MSGVCEGAREHAIECDKLRDVIQSLYEMGVLGSMFEEVHLFFVKDCNNFLINCSDLQSSSRFLTNTINYFTVFIK